jgi:hypothetical protein
MGKDTELIRISKTQHQRSKELQKQYNKLPFHKIYEKGLLFYENEKEQKYNLLKNRKSKLKTDLIGINANIDRERKKLLKVDDELSFNETLTDVFIIFKESKIDLESFFELTPNKNKYYHYLIEVSNTYNCDMQKLKQYIKEKKSLEKQTTL